MKIQFSRYIGALLCLLVMAIAPAWADTYTQTRYPIVLVHGWLGFDDILGVDYWYRIPEQLRAGGAKVLVASVSPSNSSTVRGEQLIVELDHWRALYGTQKFNLFGHSHGGPTARYVASVRPDLVASVSSVGSPHTGTPVADGLASLAPEGSLLRSMLLSLSTALSNLIGFLSGNSDPQDSLAALTALNTAGATAFNALHPQGLPVGDPCGQGAATVNGIRYYSFAGTSPGSNVLDLSDPVMLAGNLFFLGAANDGLVGRCSAHLGAVIRDDYPWNHLDEVNQLFGLRGLFSPEPASVYRAHANRLKNIGL